MLHQLFINGQFVDAEGEKTYETINPTDGMVGKEREETKGRERSSVSIIYTYSLI